MKIQRRHFLGLGAAALAMPALAKVVFAQAAWPNRVIRLVVGFPPGGGADSSARIVAARLSEIWGQQVVIENKPGAGGNIAHDTAAHAAPDGYTMLFSPGSFPIMPLLFNRLNYDPIADFAPISFLGTYPNLIVVPNESVSKTLQDFIARARANPGKVTYASPGIGTTPQLAAELFKSMAKIDVTHVPYRGVAAGAMQDLLANRVDCMFNTTGSLLAAVRAGQVRALAASSPKRFLLTPEIPTFAESGVPGFDVVSWYGLFAPIKTPRDIIQKMHQGVAQALADPAVKTKYETLGVVAESSTPEQLASTMQAEVKLWAPVIKAANIKAD